MTQHLPLTLELGCHMTTYTAGGTFGGRLIRKCAEERTTVCETRVHVSSKPFIILLSPSDLEHSVHHSNSYWIILIGFTTHILVNITVLSLMKRKQYIYVTAPSNSKHVGA